MELVEVFDPFKPVLTEVSIDINAPEMILTDSLNNVSFKSFNDYLGKTTVVFLFESAKNCLACNSQINAYVANYNRFKEKNIILLGVCSSSTEELFEGLKKYSGVQFNLYTDRSGKIFRDFGCMDGTLHGTFIINRLGHIKWQHISTVPYENVLDVLEKAEDPDKNFFIQFFGVRYSIKGFPYYIVLEEQNGIDTKSVGTYIRDCQSFNVGIYKNQSNNRLIYWIEKEELPKVPENKNLPGVWRSQHPGNHESADPESMFYGRGIGDIQFDKFHYLDENRNIIAGFKGFRDLRYVQ